MLLATYQWSLLWQYRGEYLSGLATAMEVAAVALVLSALLGLMLAVWRMASPPLSWPAVLYINIFRGIPALVSVIWVYFGLSLVLGINFTVFQAGVVALTLLYSAFLAEVFRAALLAVPAGQREAGAALGMSRPHVFALVILPQAIKIAIANVGSMFIGMVKDTSTFVVIGLLEVVHVAENLTAVTFQPFVLYSGAAVLYVVVAFIIDYLFRIVEKVLSRSPTSGVVKLLTARHRKHLEAIALAHESSPVADGLLAESTHRIGTET
ncbi:MAG: amino acid ABC transporter permease [Acidimicrobiales bacterium]